MALSKGDARGIQRWPRSASLDGDGETMGRGNRYPWQRDWSSIGAGIGTFSSTIGLWLSGAAIAVGGGVWSMHFIGMLADRRPMDVIYDFWWTFLSLIL